MADLSDAINTLVAQVAQAIYPNGTGQPAATGVPTLIYAGAPNAAQLDADLAGFSNGQGGRLHVSVAPGNTERVTTRYPADWQTLAINVPNVALTVVGQTVTVAGGGQPFAQVASLFVNGLPYPYSVQPGDTPTIIATALATLIGVAVPGVTSNGAVVTLPPGAVVGIGRVVGSGSMFRELGRQERVVQIRVWADTPAHRDATAALVDVALRGIPFLTMPDGLAARMYYSGTRQEDMLQKANLYRRDLDYCVEYATTQVQTVAQIAQVETTVGAAAGGPVVVRFD